jgi:phthiodiolone/phenolphthiodiolone dimycocerosates ketoreductase
MAHPGIATGLVLPMNPPIGDVRASVSTARLSGLDSVFVYDHFQSPLPTSVWKSAWSSRRTPSPHAIYEYQTLLGSLAARVGRMQLGSRSPNPSGATRC